MWPAGANCAEAESRANLFVMPRRDSICGPQGQITQKPRAEQIYLLCLRLDSICGVSAANK